MTRLDGRYGFFGLHDLWHLFQRLFWCFGVQFDNKAVPSSPLLIPGQRVLIYKNFHGQHRLPALLALQNISTSSSYCYQHQRLTLSISATLTHRFHEKLYRFAWHATILSTVDAHSSDWQVENAKEARNKPMLHPINTSGRPLCMQLCLNCLYDTFQWYRVSSYLLSDRTCPSFGSTS